MKLHHFVIGIFSALVFSFATASLHAQFTTASLTGIVGDSSGSAVPRAQVTATNKDTGLTRNVTTGLDGSYLFPDLPIGTYRLTVAKSGFSRYVQEGITLTVNEAAQHSVTLQVGAIQL